MGTILETLGNLIDDRLKRLNTVMPATIQEYNKINQTVTVIPCYEIKFSNGKSLGRSPIKNVPVIFMRSKECGIYFDLSEGDTVMLVFSQRELETWYNTGEITVPKYDRAHHLTDAIAIPGLYDSKNKIENPKDGINIFHKNDSININDDNITLKKGKSTLKMSDDSVEINDKIKLTNKTKVSNLKNIISSLESLVDATTEICSSITPKTGMDENNIVKHLASLQKIKTDLSKEVIQWE